VEALNTALAGKEERTQQLVSELGSLSNTLADQDAKIDRVLTQGDALLTSYADRKEEIQGFLSDFAKVSSTLAARDEELLAALNDISDVQEELASLIDRNDTEIHDMVSQLELITGTVSDNKDDFDKALRTARDGLAVYMLISRWGQWFNVRLVALQVQDQGEILLCVKENNEPCEGETNEANPSGGGGQQSSAADRSGGPVVRSRVPSRLDAASAVFGAAMGDRPGAGISYATAQELAAATDGGSR
jgi:ABC-type transporter Mla subunit MlaD